jgi:hypothetical protein
MLFYNHQLKTQTRLLFVILLELAALNWLTKHDNTWPGPTPTQEAKEAKKERLKLNRKLKE